MTGGFTRPGRGAAAAGVLLLVIGLAAPASAATAPRPHAFLFLVDRVAFEELLAVPEFRALARSGGAGLLSQRIHPNDRGLGPFLTIGAGGKSAVPFTRIATEPGMTAFPPGTFAAIKAANDDAVPGLMAQLLEGAAPPRSVAVFGDANDRFGPNQPGLLTAMDLSGGAEGRVQGLDSATPDLLGGRRTDYPALRRAIIGGGRTVADLTIVDLGDTHRIDEEAPYARPVIAEHERAEALATAGAFIRSVVSAVPGPTLVIVVTPSGSVDMRRRGDVVTPLVYAEGDSGGLFLSHAAPRGLTSESTRHPGLVLAEDVAPTILRFFGVSQPLEMTGAPMRVAGEAPFAEHLRHLEHRRIRVPVQTSFACVGLGLTLLAAGFAFTRRRVPRRALAVAGLTASAAIAIPLAFLTMGLLPHLVYAEVVPFGLVVAGLAGFLAWRFRGDDPAFPVRAIAAATALAVIVDGLFGWHAASTSLAGGTVFEGRGYGLRNVWLGPVLAGTILAASRLSPRRGLILSLGVAAFVGIPGLGSDVGGFITLSFAAWLLYFSLSRGRLGVPEIVFVLAVTGATLVMLLVADGVFNPTPTHAGRFAERVAAGGPGTLLRVVRERLAVSLSTIQRVPIAWLVVGWFGAVAARALSVGGIVGDAFDRSAGFREAMWVIAVASLVTIVVNDTGIGTAEAVTAYSIGGVVVPAVALRLRRTRGPRPRAAPRVSPARDRVRSPA